ncbi:uncharacterized protein LOC125572190 [Nematostella vectensis]|uniref:uncharacterized protein LOC125572190 n=1 Tax=Nematostella vectensis TaxID=45351 RepID=UPI002076FE00|nr:uncharacterized protein LOC125572190 [Nematostella vectensis]
MTFSKNTIVFLFLVVCIWLCNGHVDLGDVGCGPFVDNYLLGITEKSFTATSGHTGIPSLKGIAWKPTVMSVDQSLTIDLGQKMEISKFSFGGDGYETVPSPAPTNIILYYSDDGVNFTCFKKPLGSCKDWQSATPPDSLSGAHVSTYDIVPALSARYIKIDPIEPAPTLANNGSESALRVEFYGCTPVVPAIDIIFAISATSASADQIFTTMKNTCKEIVTLYGIRTIRHATIVFGTKVVTVFNLTNFTTKADAHTAIDGAVRENGIPDLVKALQQSKAVFENSPREGARRILIVMMDRSSSASEIKCKAEAVLLRRAGAMVVGVGVGLMMPVPDLGWITLNSYYVMLRPPTANAKHMCIGIMTRALKEFDVTFAIGATTFELFEAMRMSIGAIVDKYGVDTVHYSIVVYGPGVNNSVIRYSYTEFLQYNATTFKTLVYNTFELGGSGDVPVDDALRKCKITFDDAKVRSCAEKDVVIMMDKDTNIDDMTSRNIADPMETSGLRIIPVGIGPGVTRRQLLTIATNWYDVIYEAVPRNATPEKLHERTMDKVYRLYVQEIDLCFMLNAASIQADTLYKYMYNTMRSIIHQYSFGSLRYTFILYGDVPATYYSFDTIFPNKEILLRAVSRIKKATGGSGMDQAFEQARAIYANASLARLESWKILVTMMDKRSGLSEAKLKSLSAPLQNLGVLIIPVALGRYIDALECYYISAFRDNVMLPAINQSFVATGEMIMNRVVHFPQIDIVFVLSASSMKSSTTFSLMQNCILKIGSKFGVYTFHYSVILYGSSSVKTFDFNTAFPYREALIEESNNLVKENGSSAITEALSLARTVLNDASARSNVGRGVAVIFDKATGKTVQQLQSASRPLHDEGIIVGLMMPVPDLGWITLNSYYVMLRPPTANAKHMCIGIMTRALKEFDVTFAIGATTFELFEAMRMSIGAIVDKYGVDTVHYSIVVYGPGVNNSVIRYSYTEFLQYNATTFKTLVYNTFELGGSGDVPVDDALRKCKITFDDAKVRSCAEKDVVIMMDKDTNIDDMTSRNIADPMETSGLRIIPVGIGPGVTRRQLLTIATNWYDVIYEAVPRNATPEKLHERTMDKVYRLYVQEIDLCFMLNAASIQADTLYKYMYNTMRSIIHQYSFGSLRYTFILYGDVPATYYSFDTIFPNKEILLRAVSRIKKATGGSGMDQAFEQARAIYANASLARLESWKILVTMMDKRSGLSEAKLKSLSAPLQNLGVLIIPVALGRYIDALECYYISAFRDNVMLPAINQSFVATGEMIMNRVVHFPQIDIVFVLSASSMKSSTTFSLMQNCILKIGSKFGVYTFHYSVILYGSSSVKTFDFNTAFPYREALIEESNNLVKENGSSAITEALSLARTVLNDASARSNVGRGVAVIFDKATGKTVQQLQSASRPLHDEGIIVVASGVGPEVTKEEARAMTSRRNDATHVNDTYQPGPLGDHIVRRILKDGTEEMDIVFAMTLSSTSPHTMLMKTIIQMLIRRYGIYRIHYGSIVFGQTASTAFDFDSAYSDDKSFLDAVNGLAKVDDSAANVTLAIEEAYKIFTTSTTRKNSRKVLVIMIDRLTVDDQEKLKLARKRLGDLGVTIITVALGSTVDSSKIYDYCPYRGNTIYSKDGGISWDLAEKIIEKITRIPELDLTFTLSADSATPEQIYVLMKEIIKSFTTKFGTSKFRVGVVNAGSSPTRVFDFSDSLPDKESFKNEIEKISRISGSPDIPKALEEVYKVFNESSSRPTAKKCNVIIVDRPLNVAEPDIRIALKPFDEKNIITIAVGIQKANKTELVAYTESKRAVIQANATDSPMDTMDEVMKVILNDDLKPSYVTFAVSAAGINATKTLNFIKDVIKKTISRHGGTDNMKINVIVFGDKASEVISFDSDLSEEELLKAVDSILLPTGEPSIKSALDKVRKRFKESGAPADAKKLCVLMWDSTTSDSEADLMLVSGGLKKDDITLLSMPLSPEAALDAPKLTDPLLTKPPSDVPMAVESILYDGGISLLANLCEPNPCQHGGVCTESGCMCPSSYYGTYCENRKG